MKGARRAHTIVCAAALGLMVGACTLTSDLDRLKGDDGGVGGTPQDSGSDQPAFDCKKATGCYCNTCQSWCECSAEQPAWEKCEQDCVDAGLFYN